MDNINKFEFSKAQMEKLKNAYMRGGAYSMRFKPDKVEGFCGTNDKLTKRQQNKLNKAKTGGKGVELNFTNEQLKDIVEKLPMPKKRGRKEKVKVDKTQLGNDILNAPLSDKLIKKIYDMVVKKLKAEGENKLPKFDEGMKVMILSMLANNADFVKFVKLQPDDETINEFMKAFSSKKGEGIFDDVKNIVVKGARGVYKGANNIVNGIVSVVKKTGDNVVDKFKRRFTTPEGIASTLGTIATGAEEGSVGGLEGSALGALTNFMIAVGKDIGQSFVEALASDAGKIFKIKGDKKLLVEGVVPPQYVEAVKQVEVKPAEVVEQQVEPVVDLDAPIVGSGKHRVNDIMRLIMAKNYNIL